MHTDRALLTRLRRLTNPYHLPKHRVITANSTAAGVSASAAFRINAPMGLGLVLGLICLSPMLQSVSCSVVDNSDETLGPAPPPALENPNPPELLLGPRPPIRTTRRQSPPTVQRVFDPHRSWLAFVRNSDRGSNKHRTRSGAKSGSNNLLPASAGAPGPPGPPGPPGLPGALVTKEVLINEFRNVVREAAELRIQSLLDPKCEDCKPSVLDDLETSGPMAPPLFNVDKAFLVPRVTAGFMCRLGNTITVRSQTMTEIKNFHVPFGEGAFQRGEGFTPENGHFPVPRSGIYHFSINLQVWLKGGKKATQAKTIKTKSRETVLATICINSLCQKNAALESVASLSTPGEKTSLAVNGYLELKKGQYVSVFIDNNTLSPLRIHANSFFSAILVGL